MEHLKKNVDEGSLADIKEAEESIHKIAQDYHRKKSRKWIGMVFSAAFFGAITYIAIPTLKQAFSANYNRSGIESICKDKFGDTNIMDALTDEVVIVSFEFNTHTPFLFTKYNAERLPTYYN